MRHDSAFTGMEAAIVLIAFIVVASLFSYLVLGSGIHATQATEDTIHTGTENAGTMLYVSGNVKGVRTQLTNPDTLRSILIPIRSTGNREGVDISSLRIRVISENNLEELNRNQTYMNVLPKSGRWSVQSALNSDGDSVLEEGEEFLINATLIYSGDMVPYRTVTIELKPVDKAILRVSKTIPPALYPLTTLE